MSDSYNASQNSVKQRLEILRNEVLPKEVFWEEAAATSGSISYLAIL